MAGARPSQICQPTKGRHVIQGYIAVSDDGTEVRLRRMDEQCFQTVKSEGGSSATKSRSSCHNSNLKHSGRPLLDGVLRKNLGCSRCPGRAETVGGRRLSWLL